MDRRPDAQGARRGRGARDRSGPGPAPRPSHHRPPHHRLRARLSGLPLRPRELAAARGEPRALVRRLRGAALHAPDGAARPEMTGTAEAEAVIRRLGLVRHPEGGWFRETFRDARAKAGTRAASTAIYYLLQAGEIARWHRVDAAEVWHWHAGAALSLTLSVDGRQRETLVLGPDLAAGAEPQRVVPAGAWQSARSLGRWTLTGCTVAPGFEFAGFELAPEGWEPG